MFDLMSPVIRGQMFQKRVFWNRYQTKDDCTISFICGQLRKAGLIHSSFIDKWHITNVLTFKTSHPVPITNLADFVDIFTADVYTQVNAILHHHLPDHPQVAPLPGTAEAGDAVAAGPAGPAIIDATENDMDDTPAA